MYEASSYRLLMYEASSYISLQLEATNVRALKLHMACIVMVVVWWCVGGGVADFQHTTHAELCMPYACSLRSLTEVV